MSNTILAIGAHPDDIEFGCGAILLKEARTETRIHFLVCSKGESGSNGSPAERVTECRTAAESIEAELRFLDLGGDGKIERTKANAFALARAIRETQPRIVLAPTLIENQHPDHATVGALVQEACRLARYSGLGDLKEHSAHTVESLFFYAITPGAEPSRERSILVDVSDLKEDWVKLMQCHATQMQTRRYVDLQLARARVLGLEIGAEYAQALWPNDPLVVEDLSDIPRGARHF